MESPAPSSVDIASAIDLELMRGRLQAIVDEAGAAVIRTSFSPVISEAKDFACGLLQPDGAVVVQSSQSIPVFMGTMSHTARKLAELLAFGELDDDIVVGTNDPWLGTGHLYDLTLVSPIHVGGELLALSAVVGHLPDIGGRILGTGATQVFEEGLRIPPMEIASSAGFEPVLERLIRANVRLPDDVMGDIDALLNAGVVIRRRFKELLSDVTVPQFRHTCSELERRTEEYVRASILSLPDGEFSAEAEADGVGGHAFKLRVRISRQGSDLKVDFAGSSKQLAAGINAPLAYSASYAAGAIKAVLAPDLPFNEGVLRPLQFSAPEKTVVNCAFPAAGSARSVVGHLIPGVILEALAPAVPERVIAECGAPRPSVRIHGDAGGDGGLFTASVFLPGGFGARATKDGLPCLSFPSNASSISVEIIEAENPVLVEEKELVVDSGGPGRWRGGMGQQITVRCLAEEARASVVAQRISRPPKGMQGGGNGMGAAVFVNGSRLDAAPSSEVPLRLGDTITVRSPGGGGWGPPTERVPEHVARDVENDYVSALAANELYGFLGES